MRLQELPPQAARLCLEVERFLRRELAFAPRGRELLLAYSGGADSKALFFILLALLPRLECSLALVHLDHGLRPTSARELEEARRLAGEHGLACHARRAEVASLARERKIGSEEAGRLARREFFAELLRQDERRWIVTGHQLNDLAEDQLMRLLRGTGWPALGGMSGLEDRGGGLRLLRPILLTSRAKLEDFLRLLAQDWIRDPLNEDRAYLRNRVRAELLPLFQRENPSFLENAAALWRLARYDAQSAAATPVPDGPLEPEYLAALPRATRLRVYKRKLEELGPGQPLLRNLLALDDAWLSGKGGKQIQFPGNKKALLRRGGIEFLIIFD